MNFVALLRFIIILGLARSYKSPSLFCSTFLSAISRSSLLSSDPRYISTSLVTFLFSYSLIFRLLLFVVTRSADAYNTCVSLRLFLRASSSYYTSSSLVLPIVRTASIDRLSNKVTPSRYNLIASRPPIRA